MNKKVIKHLLISDKYFNSFNQTALLRVKHTFDFNYRIQRYQHKKNKQQYLITTLKVGFINSLVNSVSPSNGNHKSNKKQSSKSELSLSK